MIFVVVPYRHAKTKAAIGAMAYTGFATMEDVYRDLTARRANALNTNKFDKILEAIDRGDWAELPDDLQCDTLPKKV